jgi:hypothetical protein
MSKELINRKKQQKNSKFLSYGVETGRASMMHLTLNLIERRTHEQRDD